jgi:hypothetical protein
VIGAQKCGTTSLHFYLDQHPEIQMARGKELNFFVGDGSWAKGVDWYAAHFDSDAPVRGESSPAYTNYPTFQDVPARIHSLVPEAKLVYMVRDPVERTVSQYVHDYSTGKEDRPIEAVFEDGLATHPYVLRSKYFLQLEQYLGFFDPAAILVVAQEELLRERIAAMRRIFAFLEVEPAFYHPNFEQIKHLSRDRRRRTWAGRAVVSAVRTTTRPFHPPRWLAWEAENYLVFPFARKVERPALPNAVRERLAGELKEDVERLRELTGQEFPSWSV